MSIYDTDDDDDDIGQQDNNAMRQLRKALKAEQAKNKEFEAKLAELSTANRGRAIQDVLAGKGLTNPKIAKLIPTDIDPTAEAVGAWLEEYGDVFGVGATPEESGKPALGTDDVASLRDIDSVVMGQQDIKGQMDLLAKIQNAGSMDDLQAVLKASG